RALSSTVFPYTTLFRSIVGLQRQGLQIHGGKTDSADFHRSDRFGLHHEGCECPGIAMSLPPIRIRVVKVPGALFDFGCAGFFSRDRKSTRLNSSHVKIS